VAVRTVSVLLTADITAFRTRMGEASRTAGRTSRDIRTRMRDAGRAMVRVGENQKNALKMVQGASIGLVAAFGFAVAASARFEKAMSNVKAVSQANGAEMVKLRSAALEMGRTTAFSAVQAAEAEHELAKAGVSVADISGGALRGALNLAAAAEINVAEGAEIAANAMTVFGLKGKDVGHVADVLAAAANKSTTDVHQMGLSLRMTGQVASQTGLSLEDTVGALTLFAAEGLKGSDAGTSFKVMLQRLTPQSKEAQATMDKLGFSAYDAQGNFVGLEEMSARMKTAFAGLTPEARNSAMGIIFGSDAVRAANIIYKHGAEGVRTYIDAVNDQGYAQAVAMTRMDNLIGDLKLLRAAIESALIETGTAANSSLRDMVQWVTRLVNAYSSLPPGLQQSVGLLTGLVGVIGLAGASMLLLLPRIMLVRRELVAMGLTASVVRGQMMTLGRLGLVLGTLYAIGWAVDQVAEKLEGPGPNATKMANSLVDLAQKGKAAGELTKTFGKDLDGFGEAVKRIAHPGALDRVEDFFGTFDPGTEHGGPTLDKAKEKVEALDKALAELVQSGATDTAAEAFKRMAAEAEAQGTSAEKLLTLLPQYANALAGADTQAKLSAESQQGLGDATAMTADEMADQRTAAEKLTDALNLLNGGAISAAEGQIGFEQSLDDLAAAVKENGTSLDVTSEKGRAVKQAFIDSAKAAQEYGQSVADQKGSVEAGNAVLETSIGALKRTMKQAGFTDKQIKNLIGTYAQLPPKSSTQVKAEIDDAIRDLSTVQRKVKNTKGKKITVDTLTKEGERNLERLGFKVRRTKGKKVTITVPTGSQRSAVEALRSAIASLRDKSIRITTFYQYKGKTIAPQSAGRMSYGGIVGKARDGLYIPGYAPRVDDQLVLASRGEGVLVPETVRKGGQSTGLGPEGFIGALNAWGRFGTRMPMFADGGIVGYAKGGTVKKKTTPQSVLNARRELPGDFGDFTRSLTKSASEIKTASKALATDLKKLGRSGWRLAGQVDRTSRKLQDMATRRDDIRERIAEARQFAKDQTSGAKEFMALGDGGTAKELIGGMKEQQATAAQFQRNVNYLRQRGLHKDLLRQVIEEGPSGDLAQRLMTASSSEFQQLNQLAGKGAKLATSIGRSNADALFDAGKNASKGFLAGLISQEKALQKQMDKLGKSLVTAIKRALKIKSPSQVMRDQVGKQLGAGLVQGMDRSLADVQAAGHRMSAAAISAAWGGPPPAVARDGGGQFTGELYLDSGVFLGAVKGTVTPMIRDSEQRQAYRARVGRY
jgi:TP901 family phage tail tape measure protein